MNTCVSSFPCQAQLSKAAHLMRTPLLAVAGLLSLCGLTVPLSAQLLFNPPAGSTAYNVPDGTHEVAWWRSSHANSTEIWWNGTSNVKAADNSNVIFEGRGTVLSASDPGRASNITFRNLTGNYTVNTAAWLGNTLTVATTAGVHDIFMGQIQFSGAGIRTIDHNGGGLLTINGFNRQLSGSGRTIAITGSGTTRVQGTVSFRADLNDNAQIIKNGSGHLQMMSTTATSLQNGITLNEGSIFFNNTTMRSLNWNGGRLIFDLSTTTAESNRLILTEGFNKGGSGPYVFDFQNGGTDRTYTLLLFPYALPLGSATNFELTDFQAINVAEGGFFSWGMESIGGTDYTTLLFTVTVPYDSGEPDPEPDPIPQPESDPDFPSVATNVALNRPARASSLWTEDYRLEPAYTAERAVDGDISSANSRWIGTGVPAWLEIDLGWNFKIEGLQFWTGNAGVPWPITDFALQYWNGTGWTDLYSETGSTNEGHVNATFTPTVSGNRVRLNITGLRDDNITRLFEVKVIGIIHELRHLARSPGSGRSLLDSAAPVTIQFNYPIQSIDLSGIRIRNLTAGTDITGVTASVDGDTLIISHPGLVRLQNYAVHIPTGAVARASDASIVNGAQYWEFSTAAAAPQVFFHPRDTGSLSAPVRVVFDRAISMVDASKVRILNADDFSEIADVVATLDGDYVLNIAHAPFAPATRYIVEIEAGAVTGSVNGVANQPIRRSLFSSRYELFNADFAGSMDGFTTAGSLGFVPANQSWGLGTSSPGPGRDFTFATAGSRHISDESDFLLSPMVRLPAGETLLFTARIGLASEHLSIGLTKTPSRNDIEHIIRLGDAPVVNNARQVEFAAPDTDDYYVIFYQTGGLANQIMTLDKVVLARRALPVIRITSLQADEELLESQPVTLVAQAFAFGANITHVRFFDNDTLLGTASPSGDGEFSLPWPSRSPGVRSVTAVVTDSFGNTASYEVPVTVFFNDGTLPPFVEWNFNGSAQGWTLHNITYNNNRINIGTNWSTNNPWASSTVVFLLAGETYTLQFKSAVTTSGNNSFQIRANAFTTPGFPTPEQRAGEMAFTVNNHLSGGLVIYESTFTVPADGPYHITFYPHTSGHSSLFMGVVIDDVRVMGNLNAAPQISWQRPSLDRTTFAGATVNFAVNASDPDGQVVRVEYRNASDGSLISPNAVITSPPWNYDWHNVPVGNHSIVAYVEDNLGGFNQTAVRTIVAEPNTLTLSTYLGTAANNEAFTGAAHQSDGTLVLTGILDPTLLPGNPPLYYLGNAQPGDRGVVVRLDTETNQVLSVAVVAAQTFDMALDGADNIYVAAADAGTFILNPAGNAILWASGSYGTGRRAHRVDAGPTGTFAVISSTQPDYRDERIGDAIIHIYNNQWQLLAANTGPAFSRDIAVDEATQTIVVIGFKNLRDMDMPPWSSQFGETNEVDIPILIGVNYDGSLRWRGYDWERFWQNPDRHLNAPANNMADTRGHRVTIGPDGFLYAAFEFDGGNHPLRYSPLEINRFSPQVPIVGGDNFHNAANTGTFPKVFVGRYRVDTGEYLLGQQLINRVGGNTENTLRIKNGAIAVDRAGRIHLSGNSAAGLPLTHEPFPGFGEVYTGGAWYTVLSPDMRSREFVTRFSMVGGNNAAISVRQDGQVALAGWSPSPTLFAVNAWQSEASAPTVREDALLTVGVMDRYFKFQPGEHPRLFFNAAELAEIRTRLDREPFISMYQALLDNVEQGDFYRPVDVNDPRSRSLRATGYAFLYALSGDETFAQAARDDWAFIFANVSDAEWTSTAVGGLTLYSYATALAIAYDLCSTSPSWDAGIKYEASRRLVDVANVITDHGGSGQPADNASNWFGARGASAGLAFLATDHPFSTARADASWNRVLQYLTANSGNRPGQGWNPEGFGYTAYPFGLMIGPYGIAKARANPQQDLTANATMQRKARSGFITATSAFNVYGTGGIKTDWANDNAHIGGEGIYGQAFAYAPESWLPALRWAYDRLMGDLAPHGGNWDSVRHGSFWSILYYPEHVTPQNPMENWHWHQVSNDAAGLGLFTFRDGYVDQNDILIQFKTKNYALTQAHWGPDGLGLRVLGLGESFVIGGGRNNPGLKLGQATLYRTNPDTDSFTALNNTGTVFGTPLIKPNGGGHAIGFMPVSSVTTTNHKRWVVADFDTPATGAAAVLLVADTSDDGTFWQLPTYLDNTITQSGNTFTITGVNGASLRGTILHPGGTPVITIGTKERGANYALRNGGTLTEVDPDNNPLITENRFLHIQSSGDGDFLVVMTLQPQGAAHPAVARLSGGVADAVVQVGSRTYSLLHDNVLYDGALYQHPAVNVTFNVGTGGILVAGDAMQILPYGATPVEPMVVAEEGFAFLGWDRPLGPVVIDMNFNAVLALVGDAVPDGFDSWIARFNAIPEHLRGSMDQPLGDGIANLLRYAFNMDPTSADRSGLPTVTSDGQYLVLYYRVNPDALQAGLDITPVMSITLAQDSWHPVDPANIHFHGTDAEGNQHYSVALPLTPGPKFLSIRVAHP